MTKEITFNPERTETLNKQFLISLNYALT